MADNEKPILKPWVRGSPSTDRHSESEKPRLVAKQNEPWLGAQHHGKIQNLSLAV